MPNQHKPDPHSPQIRRAAPRPDARPAGAQLDPPPFQKERDLDGYVDAQGHPQPHQSPLEASFEGDGELAEEEASQAGARQDLGDF